MNHKRHRPKNRRAGCLLCKPHKANGAKDKEKAKFKLPKGWRTYTLADDLPGSY